MDTCDLVRLVMNKVVVPPEPRRKALVEAAGVHKLDIRKMDSENGILEGYSPAHRVPAIVSFSEANGVQVWYLYEEKCSTCHRVQACRNVLKAEAEERGIELSDQDEKLSPTLLAKRIFSRFSDLWWRYGRYSRDEGMPERWQETYDKAVEIYDSFSRFHDENRKLLKTLFSMTSFKDKTILDLGCGSGDYAEILAPISKRYVAIDVSRPMLELAVQKCKDIQNADFINCRSQQLPFKDKIMDAAFSSWGAMDLKEAMRVLKDGGDVWIFANHWEGEFMDLRGKPAIDWCRKYLKKRTEKHGFEIAAIVDTSFSFPSLEEAKRVFGFIFGENAYRYFERHPKLNIEHRVVILHQTKSS